MPIKTGTISTRARVYDMTGVAGYDPSAGVDLGKVSDLLLASFERDVTTYIKLETGSTPNVASIDGEGILFEFGLSEYSAAVMTVITQRMTPVGATINNHGLAGGSYVPGTLLVDADFHKLLIADETAPNDYPKLLIPRALVLKVDNLALSRSMKMMDPATIQVIGLYSSIHSAPFAWGDATKWASDVAE